MHSYTVRLSAFWRNVQRRDLLSAQKRCSKVGALVCLLVVGLAAAAQTPTATTLSIAPSSSVPARTVVTLTATVLAGAIPVTRGTVIFCDASATYCEDIHIVGRAQLTNSGAASIKFRPGIGSHSYKAVFAGTQTYAASSSAAGAISVTGIYPTSTSLTVGGSSGSYNLTATVTGTGSATVGAAGTVSFIDSSNNNAVLGTGTLGASTPTVALQSSGSFGTLPEGDLMGGIAVGDFNGDGIPDLAVCNPSSNSLEILLGNGDGTFTAMASGVPTGIYPVAIAVGDFNNDGVLDLAVMNDPSFYGNGSSPAITILLGNGDGTFNPEPTPPSGQLEDLVVGDFNRDGNLDIAGINTATNSIQILLGNGDGTFSAGPSGPQLGVEPSQIIVGDFNGDGIPDLAVTNTASSNVMVLLGKGDGTFTLGSTMVIPGSEPGALVEADFNGDGIQDLAVTSDLGIELLLGQGNGSFSAPTLTQIQKNSPLVVGDFNGDGIPDLALDGGSSILVYLGTGTGSFSQAASYSVSAEFSGSFVGADFNGDGIPDLAVSYSPAGYNFSVTVLLTVPQESAVATSNGTLPIGSGTHQLLAAYTGDSQYNPSQSSTVPVSAVFATTLTLALNPATGPIYAGQIMELIATLSPYAEAGYASTNGATITFYNGSTVLGTGTLSNGVATFTTAPLIASTVYTFSASYAGNSDFAAATSAVETAAGAPIATSLALTASPSAPTPGGGVTLTATLSPYAQGSLSTNGELVSFYNGSTFIGVGGVSIGVATLTLPSLSVGVQAFTASYAGDNYFGNSTATIQVDVRQTTSLSLGANPTSVTHGQPVILTATLSGAYGTATNGEAIVFSSNGTVIGSGTISAGVATVSTSTLSAGADSITAAYAGDADDSPSTSNAVTVNVTKATPTIAWATPAAITYGTALGGTQLNATASYNGSTVAGTFVYTPAAGTVLSAGTQTLSVTFTPTDATDYSTAMATVQLTVNKATPKVTVTPSSSSMGTAQTLSVPVVMSGSTGAQTPTGTVTLSGGGYTSSAETLSSGSYTFAIPANSLSAGTDTLTVSYSGDSNYVANTGSASVTVTQSVFSLAATTPAAVNPGAAATSTVTVSTANGYAGTATITCALTSYPPGATDVPTCSNGNATVTLTSTTATGTATVTVGTTAASASLAWPQLGPGRGWDGAGSGAILALLVFLGIPARRRSWRSLIGMLVLMVALGSVAACGGGGGGGGSTGPSNPGTTAGTYTFTVTGTGSPSITPIPTTTFTLTVN